MVVLCSIGPWILISVDYSLLMDGMIAVYGFIWLIVLSEGAYCLLLVSFVYIIIISQLLLSPFVMVLDMIAMR